VSSRLAWRPTWKARRCGESRRTRASTPATGCRSSHDRVTREMQDEPLVQGSRRTCSTGEPARQPASLPTARGGWHAASIDTNLLITISCVIERGSVCQPATGSRTLPPTTAQRAPARKKPPFPQPGSFARHEHLRWQIEALSVLGAPLPWVVPPWLSGRDLVTPHGDPVAALSPADERADLG